jgi:hypothetical protein
LNSFGNIKSKDLRFKVLVVVKISTVILIPCSVAGGYQHYGEICCLDFQVTRHLNPEYHINEKKTIMTTEETKEKVKTSIK